MMSKMKRELFVLVLGFALVIALSRAVAAASPEGVRITEIGVRES